MLLEGEKSQSFPEKSDVNQINKYEKQRTVLDVEGMIIYLMMTNAELKVLSVGNVKRLDTTQNTADQVMQRERSAR